MPELSFHIDDVAAMPHAATPMLGARLRIENARASEPAHSISLNCQVMIEPLGRSYSAVEEARLLDLFGERERWAQSMKPLLWTIAVLKVPTFTERIIIDVPLPCTLDFDVAATKYFYGLEQGAIRASATFSGTVFYARGDGALQVMQIPWQSEARFRVTSGEWRAAIDAHYPENQWLRLPRDTFDRLYRCKVLKKLPHWEQVVDYLLDQAEQGDAVERAVQSVLQHAAGGEH